MTAISHHVFFVSDGTGLTAEMLGETLLTQFPEIEFKRTILPYIKNNSDAQSVVDDIQKIKEATGQYPLVFSTLVDDDLRSVIDQSGAIIFDLFETFIVPLEKILDSHSTHKKGRMHGMVDNDRYHHRVRALNYSLSHDDGLSHTSLEKADVIIIGVSRCGKTPTALYMAMQFSLKAANYPLIEEDLEKEKLPDILKPFKNKLIGLNIKPEQLSRYRQERRSNSTYASLKQCKKEVQQALNIFESAEIPYLDTSSISIEEIATRIVQKVKLHRPGY
jgi:regulator of PEP synthase PpsR (kinase-PPPase family)